MAFQSDQAITFHPLQGFVGAFALLERSLRTDIRSWPTHLVRLGLMATIYLALCFALLTENFVGAPGLRLLQGIAYLDATFMALLGIGFFSTSITEEKEEDTLGLMLMAGISPLGILAGKSGARLWQALLLVAVQYPFMQLAITMGGVTSNQVWSVTVALLAFMLFLAGFGLLCSTIAPRSRMASTWTVIGLAIYLLFPSLATGLLSLSSNSRLVTGIASEQYLWEYIAEGISNVCVFFRIGDILTTGFTESAWSFQVISNGIAGTFCAGMSWMLFGLATRNPSSESNSRGLVSRCRGFFRFNAGRPRFNPFVWKDFHFAAGGIGMMLVRTAYYVALGIFCFLASVFDGSIGPAPDAFENYLVFTSLSVAIDAGLVLARSLRDEVREQTLSALLMLPRSPIAIVYTKFAGALIGWLPGPIIEVFVTLSTENGRSDVWSLLTNDGGGWALILLFVLIPHFAALAAVFVRWGAVPLAVGLSIGAYFTIVGLLFMSNTNYTQDTLLLICAMVMVCICGACHIGVLLRVQVLGTR